MPITTDDFLADVRQRGQLPTADPDSLLDPESEISTDAGLLRLGTGELRAKMVPKILRLNQEFFVSSISYPISSDGRYRIPGRAIGNILRAVYAVMDDGDEVRLTQRGAEDVDNDAADFYVEGGSIVLLDDVDAASIKMTFYARPGKLVATSRTCTVTGVSTLGGNTVITHSALPTAMSGVTKLDVVKGTSGYELHVLDATVNSLGVGSTTIAGIVTGIEVGDYLCVSGETPVIPLPEDLHPILAQHVAMKALEAIGDDQGIKRLKNELEELEETIPVVLNNRVRASPKKIRNKSMWGS